MKTIRHDLAILLAIPTCAFSIYAQPSQICESFNGTGLPQGWSQCPDIGDEDWAWNGFAGHTADGCLRTNGIPEGESACLTWTVVIPDSAYTDEGWPSISWWFEASSMNTEAGCVDGTEGEAFTYLVNDEVVDVWTEDTGANGEWVHSESFEFDGSGTYELKWIHSEANCLNVNNSGEQVWLDDICITWTVAPQEISLPSLPINHDLFSAYPNPFNPVTTIRFGVGESSFVRLSVYDILGREVAELQSSLTIVGVHEVQWNAGDLASGIYFARLQAGDNVRMAKLLLTK